MQAKKFFRLTPVILLGLLPVLFLVWSLGNLPLVHANTILVDTTADNIDSSGDCSLREAVLAANTNTAVDGCGTGAAGIDTIQFNLTTPAIITISYSSDPDNNSDLDVNTDELMIEGLGQELLILDGDDASRIFDVASGSAITLTNMTLRNGRANVDGGAINSGSAVTLINVTLLNNTAGDDGGAVNVTNNLILSRTQVLSNTAAGQGGGINSTGDVNLVAASRFANNQAGDIAGALHANTTLTVTQSEFISNSAQTSAGAIWIWGSADISDSTFTENSAQGVRSYDGMGALYAQLALRLLNTDFISNTAANKAGAVLAGGTLNVTGGLFQGNTAVAGCSGALDTDAQLWITGTHFIANQAADCGGAINHHGTNGSILNAVFGRNEADNGSALYLAHSNSIKLLHATIAGPDNPSADAVHVTGGGQLTVSNSILGGYQTALAVPDGTATEDYNLFYATTPTSGSVTSGGHSFSGNPGFVNAGADNYHLSVNSEAINTGTDAAITVDGDGDSRPGGGGYDIGYDETDDTSDVDLSKIVDTTALAGASITYTLAFTNAGTAVLPRLVLTDTLPDRIEPTGFISSGLQITTTVTDDTYAWQVHHLPPNQTGFITITGQLVDPLPRGTFTNTASITTIATETNLSNNSDDVDVTVANLAPIAVNDTYTAIEETARLLTPLANDIDGDTLTITAITQPQGGTAVLSGTQFITYTPGFEFNDTDTFTYTISDGELTDTAEIVINVTAVNDPPIISQGSETNVVMSEDSDPTPFQLNLEASDNDDTSLTWTIATTPSHGTAAVPIGQMTQTTVSYTPTHHYAGADAFSVRVSDGQLSDTITVRLTIDPVNDRPIAVDDAALALHHPQTGVVSFLVDSPDGDLNVLRNDGDVDSTTLTVTNIATGNYSGVISVTADGLLQNYTPAVTSNLIEHFVYTVNDNELSDTAVLSLTLVNGLGGGLNGDVFTVPAIGLDDSFIITTTIPETAAASDSVAVILDETGHLAQPAVGQPLPTSPGNFVPAGISFTLSAYVDYLPVHQTFHFTKPVTLTIDYADTAVTDIGASELSLTLFQQVEDGWSSAGITTIMRDTDQHQLIVTVDRPGRFALFHRAFIFLPIALNNYIGAPDLVVDATTIISAGTSTLPGEIQVIIRNAGTTAVTDEFWIDLYLNPHTPPTAVNQTWEMLGEQGMVWGIVDDALPLAPGESLTLTSISPYYAPNFSRVKWPVVANTPIYVQVDSIGVGDAPGAVLEIHEIRGAPTNNIFKMP